MEAVPTGPTRVLLVEDEITDALVVQRSLRNGSRSRERFSHQHAHTLAQGIEQLSGSAVDVLLFDLRLPDSEGTTTVTRLRERDRGVPLVVFTGDDDPRLAARRVRGGRRRGPRQVRPAQRTAAPHAAPRDRAPPGPSRAGSPRARDRAPRAARRAAARPEESAELDPRQRADRPARDPGAGVLVLGRDAEDGWWRCIEGNTNVDGSPEGTGVFKRRRQFGTKDATIFWWL